MKIQIKKYLIQEGILDSIKNNWGKILVGGVAIAAANAGAFGEKAQNAVKSGGQGLKELTNKAMDSTNDGLKKVADYYKDPKDDPVNILNEKIKQLSDSNDSALSGSDLSEVLD
jgi:hypothetical protein